MDRDKADKSAAGRGRNMKAAQHEDPFKRPRPRFTYTCCYGPPTPTKEHFPRPRVISRTLLTISDVKRTSEMIFEVGEHAEIHRSFG